MIGARRPLVRVLALAWVVLAPLSAPVSRTGEPQPPGPGEAQDVQVLSSDLRIRVRSGRYIELEVLPAAGEGFGEVARRVAGSQDHAAAIEAWNPVSPSRADRFIRVPLAFLSDDYRAFVLESLFPLDSREGSDWIHVTRSGALPTYDEGLWQVAEWFCGQGARFDDLRKANALASPEVSPGQRIRIPAALLHASLAATPRSDDGQLLYSRDARGPYAGYRLKPGEALYSAVVIRFTGRTSPEDVSATVEELKERSDIRDLRDIPVHYLVKIPLEALEPEFLPAGHPRRKEAEAARAEAEAALVREPVSTARRDLKDVVVILDPGHGGRDLGTMNHGIWEHDYVYDVACRLKSKLERETAARVFLTLEDAETGCTPSAADRLKANYQGTVRSSPPFLAVDEGEASIAVNLRWYVANSLFRKVVREGVSPDRVVFVSLHADARHASLRGAMVYVPGALHRARSYGYDGGAYGKFLEVQEARHVRLSRQQRARSEAVSRKLASAITETFRNGSLPVQPDKPIRSEVIRGGSRWLPAVLKGSAVPASVLIEMVNLSNREDATLLSATAGRERIASALVSSLIRYFGAAPAPAPRRASAAR